MKKVNRRSFLKQAAGTMAGAISIPYLVPACVLGQNGNIAPSNRLTFGSIGLGGQGSYNLAEFQSIPGTELLALCDVDRGSGTYDYLYQYDFETKEAGLMPAVRRAQELYTKLRGPANYNFDTYDDFRDVLARKDIDFVVICTPDHWHGLVAIAAAKAGKDIYCEKPLVNTVAEGRAVCDAVKRYNRVLQTGSHERSRVGARKGCELVRNGRIGKLHTIRVNMPVDTQLETPPQPPMPCPKEFNYDFWLGPTPKFPYTQRRSHFWWRYILAYGGGEMTDRGAHIIDLGQLGGGTDDTGPVEIKATGQSPKDGLFNTHDKFNFECRYANGVRMIGSNDEPRGVKFEGSDGSLFIHVHGGMLEANPASILHEEIGPNEIHLGRSPSHRQNFLDAIRTRGETFAHAEIGHRTATICHLVNIALQTGRPIKWDPVKEQITNDPEANRMTSRSMRSPWKIS